MSVKIYRENYKEICVYNVFAYNTHFCMQNIHLCIYNAFRSKMLNDMVLWDIWYKVYIQ